MLVNIANINWYVSSYACAKERSEVLLFYTVYVHMHS